MVCGACLCDTLSVCCNRPQTMQNTRAIVSIIMRFLSRLPYITSRTRHAQNQLRGNLVSVAIFPREGIRKKAPAILKTVPACFTAHHVSPRICLVFTSSASAKDTMAVRLSVSLHGSRFSTSAEKLFPFSHRSFPPSLHVIGSHPSARYVNCL